MEFIRFIPDIIKILVEEYKLSESEAESYILNSHLIEFFEKNPKHILTLDADRISTYIYYYNEGLKKKKVK